MSLFYHLTDAGFIHAALFAGKQFRNILDIALRACDG